MLIGIWDCCHPDIFIFGLSPFISSLELPKNANALWGTYRNEESREVLAMG